MPIYEFECPACGEHFEELVLGSKNDIKCPRCGSSEVKKKVSTFGFKCDYKFVGAQRKKTGGCSGCTSSSYSSCGG